MSNAKAALVAISGFEKVAVDEFNDWLDTEHIPERLALAGFMRAERWIADDASRVSLVLYELSHTDVLRSEAYLRISGDNLSPWSKRVLGRCRRIRFDAEAALQKEKPGCEHAEGILLVAANIAPEAEAAFNEWYDREHVPSLMAVDGILGVRRYRALKGGHRHVAIHHLASRVAKGGPAYALALDAPLHGGLDPAIGDRVVFVGHRYIRPLPES